jgi:LCP family protein required for cell wall assembly
VINILLVGSDSSAGLDEDDPIQIGRQGERLGDVIIVAHVDERSGGVALLSLPRDLWVEIGDTGRESRINQAFLVGGPATLIDTIEGQFDIPIHHYVNVDFAGFQGLVSAVGSVDVYFETPARDWNVNARPEPRSQTGFLMETAGCQSLDPGTALAYVRSRYYQTQAEDGRWVTDPTSDLGRIRRQQDFLRRVLKRAIDLGARNPFVLRDLIDTGLENVAIDQALTPQLLLDLGMAYRGFDPDQLQTYSFPAVDGQVGRNRVLLPQVDQADGLLELFRGAPFDDPSTVDLTVRLHQSNGVGTDDGEDPSRLGGAVAATSSPVGAGHDPDPVAALRRAGFGPTVEVAEGDDQGGLIVRHGPDGVHAAQLVVEALSGQAGVEQVGVEQVGGLPGRSVVLVVGSGSAATGSTSGPPDGGATPPVGGPTPPSVDPVSSIGDPGACA